jgi:uncharacterized membrane protein YbhN (UPF0104 family)
MKYFDWKKLIKPAVIVAAFLCLLLTLGHSVKDISKIPTPNMGWLGLGMGLFLIHYLIQAVGWHYILRALGQPAPLKACMRMWYMSMIARWMPGRIWYSATRLYMAREAGISVVAVTFAIVLELIYILIGGIIATVMFAGSMLKGILASSGGQSTFIILSVVILGCAALALRPSTLVWMCRFSFFRKAVQKLAGETLTDENMPSMSTGRSLSLLLYYTIFWIYSGVMFGVIAHAFIPHMTQAIWLASIPAFAGSWLVGFFAIITPAGLGVREGAMWFMLKPVMPQSEAIVLALASRLMMFAAEILSVAIMSVVLRVPISPKKKMTILDPAKSQEPSAIESLA